MLRRSPSEWKTIIQEFIERQQEYHRRQEAFAEKHGIALATFRAWLGRLAIRGANGFELRSGSAIALPTARPVYVTQDSAVLTHHTHELNKPQVRKLKLLNERDVTILKGLAHDRVVDVSVLAERHWNGSEPKARDRLRELESLGYVQVLTKRTAHVCLTRKGARSVGAPNPRRMHPRHLEHHLATLRAIEQLRRDVACRGGHFVDIELHEGQSMPYQLEIHVQSLERAMKSDGGTAFGTTYDVAPDGVVRIALPDGAGGFREQLVAVEYYTHAYSDQQMAAKSELQRHYDVVWQVSDNATTAERVERITGASCKVL